MNALPVCVLTRGVLTVSPSSSMMLLVLSKFSAHCFLPVKKEKWPFAVFKLLVVAAWLWCRTEILPPSRSLDNACRSRLLPPAPPVNQSTETHSDCNFLSLLLCSSGLCLFLSSSSLCLSALSSHPLCSPGTQRGRWPWSCLSEAW